MNILNQKVAELQELALEKGINLMSEEFVSHDNAHVIANKQAEKIVVLMSNKAFTKLKSYSVCLERWLDAEKSGLNSDQIIKGLSILRTFGCRPGQRFISKGDIFQQIDMSVVPDHLEIIS